MKKTTINILAALLITVFAQAQNPPAGGANGNGQYSNQINTALTNRLPTGAQGNANSVKDIATFMSWTVTFIFAALAAAGLIKGAAGKGFDNAFNVVVAVLALGIVTSIILTATA